MATMYILVVLAKGAQKIPGRYQDIDEEVKERIYQSLDWSQTLLAETYKLWAFGAGTDFEHRHGKTLAHHMAEYLHHNHKKRGIFANCSKLEVYGTFEEIEWIVDTVEEMKKIDYKFVFFTQRRHMYRVKLIWWLFYQKQWGEAEFVVMGHKEEIPWSHEAKAVAKVVLIKWGFIKPRSASSYTEKQY